MPSSVGYTISSLYDFLLPIMIIELVKERDYEKHDDRKYFLMIIGTIIMRSWYDYRHYHVKSC